MALKSWIRGDTKKYRLVYRNKTTMMPIPLSGRKLFVALKLDKELPDDATEGAYIFRYEIPQDADADNGKALVVIPYTFTSNVLPGIYWFSIKLVDDTASPTDVKTMVDTQLEVIQNVSSAIS